MSTIDTAVPTSRIAGVRVSQRRVLASEWTKFRSVRSTGWTLLATVVLVVGIGALASAVQASHANDPGVIIAPASTSLVGIQFAQLAIGVLGVLVISGEYGTGMIRASMTAVPKRLPVMWGKLAVFSVAAFAVSLVAGLIAFLVGQAVLSTKGVGVSITSPHAISWILGGAAYLMLVGAIAVAFGALLRNTAAGISTFVAAFFIVPPLVSLLPAAVSDAITPYLPFNAGLPLFHDTSQMEHVLDPGAGLVTLVAYVVVLVTAAAWRLRRRDV